jgi:hypothetical protein
MVLVERSVLLGSKDYSLSIGLILEIPTEIHLLYWKMVVIIYNCKENWNNENRT